MDSQYDHEHNHQNHQPVHSGLGDGQIAPQVQQQTAPHSHLHHHHQHLPQVPMGNNYPPQPSYGMGLNPENFVFDAWGRPVGTINGLGQISPLSPVAPSAQTGGWFIPLAIILGGIWAVSELIGRKQPRNEFSFRESFGEE